MYFLRKGKSRLGVPECLSKACRRQVPQWPHKITVLSFLLSFKCPECSGTSENHYMNPQEVSGNSPLLGRMCLFSQNIPGWSSCLFAMCLHSRITLFSAFCLPVRHPGMKDISMVMFVNRGFAASAAPTCSCVLCASAAD